MLSTALGWKSKWNKKSSNSAYTNSKSQICECLTTFSQQLLASALQYGTWKFFKSFISLALQLNFKRAQCSTKQKTRRIRGYPRSKEFDFGQKNMCYEVHLRTCTRAQRAYQYAWSQNIVYGMGWGWSAYISLTVSAEFWVYTLMLCILV